MTARTFRAVYRGRAGRAVTIDVDLGFSRWRQGVTVQVPRRVTAERFVASLLPGALVDYRPGDPMPVGAYTAPAYTYPAAVLRVTDGDTFAANLDVGLGEMWLDQPVRLFGVNLIESKDVGGPESTANTAAELGRGGPGLLLLHTVKPDKYAPRIDALVRLPDGTDLCERLLATGWAVPYTGRGPKLVPPWPIRPPSA